MDLKESALLGDGAAAHWYYCAKFAALLALLGGAPAGRVLDIGAGSGFFARRLLATTGCREAVCLDPGYAGDSDETVAGKPLHLRRAAVGTPADIVLLMDVLEHVPDEAALLRPHVADAAPGTRFIISVPAFNWLWSGHDVFLGHYRRYTLRQIVLVCRAAGLEIDTACYFYATVLPLAVAQRALGRLLRRAARSQLRPHGGLINALLLAACRAELGWFRRNRRAGLTAFVAARKP